MPGTYHLRDVTCGVVNSYMSRVGGGLMINDNISLINYGTKLNIVEN